MLPGGLSRIVYDIEPRRINYATGTNSLEARAAREGACVGGYGFKIS